jgi:hypothetical protein
MALRAAVIVLVFMWMRWPLLSGENRMTHRILFVTLVTGVLVIGLSSLMVMTTYATTSTPTPQASPTTSSPMANSTANGTPSLLNKPLVEQKDQGTTLIITVKAPGPYISWVGVATPAGAILNETGVTLGNSSQLFTIMLGPSFPAGLYTVTIHGPNAPSQYSITISGAQTGYPDPTPYPAPELP